MQAGKMFILLGVLCVIIGALMLFRDKIPFAHFLGQLPGDLSWKRDGYEVHFPIVTCIVISVVLSLILRLFRS